jgi:hypothetical protein
MGHEGQPYLRRRASYELAGCCRLTLFTSRGQPETVRRRVTRDLCIVAVPAVSFPVPASQKEIDAMNVTETTRRFLEFYGDRGHQRIRGSSLVRPDGDPVLFTTSGMHPLTSYLEGRPHPVGRRLTGVQRCLRTTDLDSVGDDRHLTVFQMLGSWSLGDYDGPQSLRWGCELIVGNLGISLDRLHATVFGGDQQTGPDVPSLETWAELGVPVERPRTTTGGRTARLARAGRIRRCSSGPATGRPRARRPPTGAGWSCGIT